MMERTVRSRWAEERMGFDWEAMVGSWDYIEGRDLYTYRLVVSMGRWIQRSKQ